jgi:pimeloyl-ACP methyl ester carboxylesterase
VARSNLEVRHIDANGLRFAYIEEGEGPLALLLHGFPDTAHTWGDLRPRLAAKGYRAVSPWMRGYKPTAIPEQDADLETLSYDAGALIGALGETSAVVIGHDWGAAAAYGLASIDPSRVKKLFVVGSAHPSVIEPTPSKAWGFRHFVAYKLPGAAGRFAKGDFAALPAIYKRWSPTWSPSPEEFAAVRESFADPRSLEAAFGYYRALSFVLPRFFRRHIEVPTVAFAGRDDHTLKPSDFERARPMFSAGYVVETMPGGHFLHREHPEVFAEKLLAHLGEPEPPEATTGRHSGRMSAARMPSTRPSASGMPAAGMPSARLAAAQKVSAQMHADLDEPDPHDSEAGPSRELPPP